MSYRRRMFRRSVATAVESLERRTLFTATFTYADVAAFDLNSGAFPQGSLVMDKDGNIFGTASRGGDADPLSLAGGDGAIFERVKSTNQIIAIATFDGSNGREPTGLTMDGNGDLFGVTREGGDAQGDGTVFKVALSQGSNEIQTLALFDSTTGIKPNGNLFIDTNGNVFGTTPQGGISGSDVGSGTVWELASGASTITTLATFDPANGGGANPNSNVVFDSSGKLYVTTTNGGPTGNGTVSTVQNGQPVVLASFNLSNGRAPTGNTAIDANGNIFGAASGGGDNSEGNVWELPAGGDTIQVLASFDGIDNNQTGAEPESGVTLDANGNLFGTATNGGANGAGTIWELPSGVNFITAIVQLSDQGSTATDGPLLTDTHGNLFGLSRTGGANDLGKLYELTTSEPINPIHLAFDQQPTDTTIIDSITPPVTVQVLDADNNLVTAENAVTMSIASGPAGAVLGGTTMIAVIDGIATFDKLALNTPGTYTLFASDGAGTTPATSDPFDVTFPGGGNGAITAAFQRTTLPATFVPGDRGVAVFQLQNAGNTLARGVVRVQMFLSPTGQMIDAVPVATPAALANLPVILAAGRQRPLVAPFSIPQNIAVGNEQLLVTLTPVGGFASSSVNTQPIVDANVEQAALN
ncbi:MAG TPA: choice-of-anchor tandem repeat GloVer-containing protein, partial [Tepidisphaeraceae bacterium]|nr:choice-of-anchor tandem repeat GloVer-containing protein [Tepidisphaeraceae bacterium]